LKGRDVLVVDAVLESGVTQEFLLRRLGESKPRSIRLAVLLDKPAKRRVALEPDYFGFRTASNQVWVGYGLAAANGMGRNLRQLSSGGNGTSGKSGKGRRK
jgi:hypoxanthine phosphoribosyltransferase